MNNQIRSTISNHVSVNGPSDSRIVIALMAHKFGTSKQRISGNISFMVCKEGTINITPNRPNSIIY